MGADMTKTVARTKDRDQNPDDMDLSWVHQFDDSASPSSQSGANKGHSDADQKKNSKVKDRSFSIQRYIINVIVRSVFFLLPIPVHKIIFFFQDQQYFPLPMILAPDVNYLYIPLGLSIALIGLLIGGLLDIVMPKQSVVGGRLAVKSFNIGTLSWFEGLRFSVSLDVAASGKGIAVKDTRE